MLRPSVVLPEPLSPTSATISPRHVQAGVADGAHRGIAYAIFDREVLNADDGRHHTAPTGNREGGRSVYGPLDCGWRAQRGDLTAVLRGRLSRSGEWR